MPAAKAGWRGRRRRGRPRRARAAPVGHPARPAVRLQRRRERALRRGRDRDVRAHLQPALLHQPAGLHVPAARRLRARLRRARRGLRGLRGRPRRRLRRRARRCRRCSARSPSGCLAWAGARLFDRRVGLVAAALLAVAFLPVHYGHFALNDVPTLAPVCLALVGVAGVFTRGRLGDYALAGAGLGLACATKYTGGIVLLPLLAAVLAGAGGVRRPAGRRPRARGRAGGARSSSPPTRTRCSTSTRSATASASSRRRRATAAASSA